MRIRVKDAHSHVLLVPVLLGILILAALGWRLILPPFDDAQFRGATSPFVLLASLVLLIVVPARCQHMEWCALYGATLGAGMFAAPLLVDVLIERSYLMFLRPSTFVSFVTLSLLGAPFGAIILVVWTLVFRRVVWAIRIQDGTLCPNCAYCVTGLPSNVCPECGQEFKISAPAPAKTSQPTRIIKRWKRLLAILIVAWGAVVASRLVEFTPPVYALLDGRYWKHVLTASERGRAATRWLLASIVKDKSRTRSISDGEVRAIMGPPNLVWNQADTMEYLYFALHPVSRGKGEIYIEFKDRILQNVGYNVSSVNDLSEWVPYQED